MKTRLKDITLNSGDKISIIDGVTVLVGPNNVGKSLLLREVTNFLSSYAGRVPDPGIILERVDIDFNDSFEDIKNELKERYEYILPGEEGGQNEPIFRITGETEVILNESRLNYIVKHPRSLDSLTQHYCLHLPTDNRTSLTKEVDQYHNRKSKPRYPLQRLFIRGDLENILSDLTERTFGTPLTLHRCGGTKISLHMGKIHEKLNMYNPDSYVNAMRTLPEVNSQGDGMRSFVGLALAILAGGHNLLLIDEPEAFLHPPQARNLGKILKDLRQDNVQVVVATHSSDVIKGLTESNTSPTQIAIHRLTRTDNVNHIASLSSEAVEGLYRDPLLKYSSIIDGLFYHGVILCESEGDCTYYSIVKSMLEKYSELDLHFTHCNGKDRLAKAVTALRTTKVPVVSIVDIDILQDTSKLRELINAHNGRIDSIEEDLRIIQKEVSTKGTPTKRTTLRKAFTEAIDSGTSPTLKKSELSKLRSLAKDESGWKKFKKRGKRLLRKNHLASFNRVSTYLSSIGIFIVQVGELERFHPEISQGHKPTWLQEVLITSAYEKRGSHKGFIGNICKYILGMQ